MQYYILEQDLDDPDAAAIGEIPDFLNVDDWYSGKKLPSPPSPLMLRLYHKSGDSRGDIMGGIVTLFSDELAALLRKFGIDSFQSFPVEIEDPISKEVEEGYNIVNILGLIKCVDIDSSQITSGPMGGILRLESFNIDTRKSHGFSMFRLYEQPTLIIIDESIKQFLFSSDMVGLKITKTQDYDGW